MSGKRNLFGKQKLTTLSLLLSLLLLFVINHASANEVAIPQGGDEITIVGGEPAAPGAWPWMASIMSASSSNGFNAHFCGGALIAPEWVLTASHCVINTNANTIDVTVGRHRLSSNDGQRVRAAQIIMHPQYNDNTLDYDVALIRLSQPINGIQTVGLVRTPTNGVDGAGKDATITGWGALQQGGAGPDVLHQVTVPVVAQATCNQAYNGDITARMICAGLQQGGQDSCQGDSGGPMVVRNAANDGYLQAGVVSWGNGCAQPNSYGVYARVSEFVNWIETHTGDLGDGGGPVDPPIDPPVDPPTGDAITVCSSSPVAINDNGSMTTSIEVPNSGTITDVNISVETDHSWIGDLTMRVRHSGNAASIIARPGVPASEFGCDGAGIDATLDDEAASAIESACGTSNPAISGDYRPNNPLTVFDGSELSGTWELIVTDAVDPDTGDLIEWCVIAEVDGDTPPPPPPSDDATVSVSDYEGATGDSVTVSIDATDLPANGLAAGTFDLNYNATVLRADSCVADPASAFDGAVCNAAFDNNTVRVSLTDATGVSGNSELAQVTFTVIGDGGSTSALDVEVSSAADAGSNALTIADSDGTFTVSSGMVGDVSCDDNRNILDVLYILQHEVGTRSGSDTCPIGENELYTPGCDVNGDDSCNVLDALLVVQCDVGIGNVLCPSSRRAPSGGRNAAPGTVSIDSTTVSPATVSDVVVSAEIPAESLLAAATLEITYDPALATPVSCTTGDSFFGSCNIEFENDGSGTDRIRLSVAGATGVTGQHTLATIGFEGVANGVETTSDLGIEVQVFADGSGGALGANINNGSITWSSAPTAVALSAQTASITTSPALLSVLLLTFGTAVVVRRNIISNH